MIFRGREKARYAPLKRELFSPAAQLPGPYRGIPRCGRDLRHARPPQPVPPRRAAVRR
jgi:hypothetical protein